MSLHLKVRLDSDPENGGTGLLGGIYEYAPYICSWATWGLNRMPQQSGTLSEQHILELAPIQLPTTAAELDSLRGDERICLDLQTLGRSSGIGSIDEQEKGRNEYQNHSGMSKITLAEILLENAGETGMYLAQIDPILALSTFTEARESATTTPMTAEQREIHALTVAYKERIHVSWEIRWPNKDRPYTRQLQRCLQQTAQRESATFLMYDSPRMMEATQRMQEIMLMAYSRDFYAQLDTQGQICGPATYPLGEEVSLDHMHLPLYQSAHGALPPLALSQHRAETRPEVYARMTEREKQHYAPNVQSARVITRQLTSACRRFGMTPDQFLKAIDAQMSQSHSDSTHRDDYLTALFALADMGTTRGNSLNYRMDMRYPNKAVLTAEQRALLEGGGQPVSESKLSKKRSTSYIKHYHHHHATLLMGGKALISSPFHSHWRHLISARYTKRARLAGGEIKKPPVTLALEQEAMEPDWTMKMTNEDCEGSDMAACEALRLIPLLARAVSKEEFPMIHAAARICALRFESEGVASVRAAFVDTSGAELSKEAQRQMTDLPMIGDDLDKRSSVAGHSPGIWWPRPCIMEGLQRAGVDVEKELPEFWREVQQMPAWAKREPILILEGTARIEATVLPAGEIAQQLMSTGGAAQRFEAEAAVRKDFVKSLIATLAEGQHKSPLVEYAHVASLSYYIKTQDLKRRISNFYLGFSHFIIGAFAQKYPRFAQLAVINTVNKTRGGEVGEVLRMPWTSNTSLGFVPSYGGLTQQEWDVNVQPVMEAIQNQMPIAAVDFFPNEASGEMAALKCGYEIAPAVLASGFAANSAGPALVVSQGLERYARGVSFKASKTATSSVAALLKAGPPVVQAASLPRPITLNFAIQSWMLQESDCMHVLVSALDDEVKAKRLVSYAFMGDRPLPQGPDVVTLIATLPAPPSSAETKV